MWKLEQRFMPYTCRNPLKITCPINHSIVLVANVLHLQTQCLCVRAPSKRKLDGSNPTSELCCVPKFASPNLVVFQVNKSHLLRYLLDDRRNVKVCTCEAGMSKINNINTLGI